MSGGKRHRRGGRVALILVVVLVLGTAAGLGAWRLGALDRWLDGSADAAGPAEVAPPEGLDLPPLEAPDPLLDAITSSSAAVDGAALAAALAPYVADDDLGPRLLVGVAPLSGGDAIVSGPAQVTPASTTKLLTSVAALESLGPDRTFSTTVVDGGTSEGGVRRVVLVGGGDPLLVREPVDPDGTRPAYPARASLRELAERTAEALRAEGTAQVELAYDAGLFTGAPLEDTWPASYVPDDVVAPVGALMVDRGRAAGDPDEVVDDPALDAASWFAAALAQQGIAVTAPPAPGLGGAGAELASVTGAPLADVVERLLTVSDNETTEVLAHHVGLEVAGDASFEGGAAAVRTVLADLGVDLAGDVLNDGSGLSRENRLSAATLLGVLGLAASSEHPELRAAVTGLPVAGFSGSLTDRFAAGDPVVDTAGAGAVRAKTGTLTGVQGLAGIVTDATGTPLRFVVVADAVAPEDALDGRQGIDAIAAALAACTCTARPASP